VAVQAKQEGAHMAAEAEAKPKWKRWVGLGLRVLLVLFVVNAALGLVSAWASGAKGAFAPQRILLAIHNPATGLSDCQACSVETVIWLVAGLLLALGLILFVRLGAAVAILLAIALIWGTLASTGADLWGDVSNGRPGLLAMVVACWGGALLIGAIRWGVLLSVQGIHLSIFSLLRLTLIGHFFNTSLPGAVTGDLLKMGYVSDHSGARQAEAVLTIFLDRIIGVLGLCIVASAMVLWNLNVLIELGKEHRPLQLAAYTVGLGSIGGILFVLAVEVRGWLVRFGPISLLLRLAGRILPDKLVAMVTRLANALELYRGQRAATLKALLLAVCVHLLLGLGLYCSGRGIHEHGLRPRDYFLTAQVANSVAAIPLTPGGVGTRDMTTKEYFIALGAKPADKVGTIPVVMTLAMVGWALVGSVVFVLSPRRKPVPEPEPEPEPEPRPETETEGDVA
jgi:uncharacterized membrane protein YbhN (UPF0104 family)